MSQSDDIREAAGHGTCEKCGHVSYHRGMDCIYATPVGALCPDCMYEALWEAHPADDAEPVTEEWLREVGFEEVSGHFQFPTAGIRVWRGNAHGDWQVRYELSCCNRHKSMETRGDVRQLCRALGIELKETP